MGGSETVEWLDALGASFEAALAREDDAAAADLAFSLRQDVSLREAVTRATSGWAVMVDGETRLDVDEVGLDYVRAGAVLVPLERAVLRSTSRPSPRVGDAHFLEIAGAACRSGLVAEVTHRAGTLSGTLVRVGRDHLALVCGGAEVVVSRAAVERIRLGSYSASRGFSG